MANKFKLLQKRIDHTLETLDKEELETGTDTTSPEYAEARQEAKKLLLEGAGVNFTEYSDWEENLAPLKSVKKEDLKPMIQESVKEAEASRPQQLTTEDMEQVVDSKKWRSWKKKRIKQAKKGEWADNFRDTFKDFKAVPKGELEEKIEEAVALAVENNPDDDLDNPEAINESIREHTANYWEETEAKTENVMTETNWNKWSRRWKDEIMSYREKQYPNIGKKEFSKRLNFILEEGKAQNDMGTPYDNVWDYIQKQRRDIFDESKSRELDKKIEEVEQAGGILNWAKRIISKI